MSNSLGVSVGTVKNWISVLETSYIIFLLPPYYNNFNKRIIKSPKIYFYDTGLVSTLTGIQSENMYEDGPMAEAIFEKYIVSEVKKKILHSATKGQIYYYRTSNQLEVDLIIEEGTDQKMVEIKNTRTFRSRMLKPILSILPEKGEGFLLYKGDNLPFSKEVTICHYNDFLYGKKN